ncbi:MAG: LytR/AlgR family response regulator transcription factor [Bacteroidia bacterium]
MTLTRKYRCLVVDDEPIARKIVKNYILQLPNLELAGECKNAFEALELINSDETIEIVFLDINMPNINGMAMVKILSRQPQIIFTTAYSEFAIESYDINAADYLLKPFLFERFAKAVFKAAERIRAASINSGTESNLKTENTIFLKSNGEKHPVSVNEIVYCEAMKNYTKVVTVNNKSYLPLVSLSKFEAELNEISNEFYRIHRSFIISKKHLTSVGSNYVMLGEHKLPIGDQFKETFLSQLVIK